MNQLNKKWKQCMTACALCLLVGLMMLPCCAVLADDAQEKEVLVLPAPDVYFGLADEPEYPADKFGPDYYLKVVVYPEDSVERYAALLEEEYGLSRKIEKGFEMARITHLVDGEGKACVDIYWVATKRGNSLWFNFADHCATAALETLDSPKDVIPETEAHWKTCDSCDGQMMCLECEGWGETLLLPFIEPLLPFIEPLLPYFRPLQLLAWTVDCESCKDGQCPNGNCVNGEVFNPPDEDELALEAYFDSLFRDPHESRSASQMTVTARLIDPATNELIPVLDGVLHIRSGSTTHMKAGATNPVDMSIHPDENAAQFTLECIQRNGDRAFAQFEKGDRVELGDVVLTPFDPGKPYVRAQATRHEDGTVTYTLELVGAPDAQIRFIAAEYAADVPAGSLDRVLYNHDEQFTGEGFALTDAEATGSSVTFAYDGTQVEVLKMRFGVELVRELGAQMETLWVEDKHVEDGLRIQLDISFGERTSYLYNMTSAAPQAD